MAKLLQEIEWDEPLIAPRSDTESGQEYEASLYNRVSPWFTRAILSFYQPMKYSYTKASLMEIAYLVTSQENACRYCYGTSRAIMKIWGYSEKQIRDMEQEASLADGITRRVIEFARKLARSNPLPARRDREVLLEEGMRPEEISEIAACVMYACFGNRTATFLALPPNTVLESIPSGLIGKITSIFVRKKLIPKKTPPPGNFRNEGPCASIIEAAGNTRLAAWLRNATDGCLTSPVLSERSKLLMLAVISRQLGAGVSEREARENLRDGGLPEEDLEEILSNLRSPLLKTEEEKLLRWTRETVWYEPKIIQNSTRRLLSEVGEEMMFEAVGTAALCNSLARLSLVQQ